MENSLEARLAENLRDVRRRIAAAAQRAGRDPDEVRLVAVAKGQPTESIRAAYGLGVKDIGENRVEEALPKQEALSDLGDICWHMVGHIQSRKAEKVARAFQFVQSIDRLKIAHLLSRDCVSQGRAMPVLMECNVSGEVTKYGWAMSRREDWGKIFAEFGELLSLPGLDICGLMTLAPWTQDTNLTRSVFRTLRELRDRLSNALPGRFRELSMGMTDDFEIAVEEGATMVRIGRALFGERSP